MAKIIASFVLTFFVCPHVLGIALPFEGLFRLDIVHYNDFHARFEETSQEATICRFNNNSCLGGFPRLYHEVKALMKEKPDSILLNAGDSFQGTYWYTLLKWNVTQEFMNLLPHDAHAIGNHDFDNGPSGLAPYLKALKAPALAANMDSTREPSLQGLYKPSIVIQRKGRKIGIIGLVTPDTLTLSSPGGVKFTDPRAATKREAKLLADRGVDIIILLSHCGMEVDKELAREHGQYVDVIVGGHSHRDESSAAASYPVIVESSGDLKHKVVIVQASAFTKYVGNLSVYFDFRGDYVKWEGGAIFLNRSVPEDIAIKSRLEPYARLVHEAEKVSIGESRTLMRFEDCWHGECALGDLMVDAFNEYAKETVNSPYDYLSFVQRSNIKFSITKGNITRGDIVELLPFYDHIETFQLRGAYVLEALERSIKDLSYHPFKAPWLLQVSGLEVSYNLSKPEGQRVTSAYVGEQKQPLVRKRTYQVTAPSYLADGGEGFLIFKIAKRNNKILDYDQAVMQSYINKHSPINITTNGRITINR